MPMWHILYWLHLCSIDAEHVLVLQDPCFHGRNQHYGHIPEIKEIFKDRDKITSMNSFKEMVLPLISQRLFHSPYEKDNKRFQTRLENYFLWTCQCHPDNSLFLQSQHICNKVCALVITYGLWFRSIWSMENDEAPQIRSIKCLSKHYTIW